MTPSTFAALLDDQVRRSGGRPLVTFYDDATGERIELSVTTYANWVAKTAGLMQDELDVDGDSTVLIDLPTHWLGPVWLGAVLLLGARLAFPDDESSATPDLVVCGPDGLVQHSDGAAADTVVALSLKPMGARFSEPLPVGVIDYGAVIWGQPDAFIASDPPAPDAPAWARVRDDALASPYAAAGTRLLTDVSPTTRAGLVTLLGPLLAGGATVWVAHPDPTLWSRHAESERTGVELRR